MPRERPIDLVWPAGGVDRRHGYQRQPPYTTVDAANVRTDATREGRDRGGSRPGLVKAFYEQMGSGAAVRMLAPVSYIQTDGLELWEARFQEDTLGSEWVAPSWIHTPDDGAPLVYENAYATAPYATGGTGDERAAVVTHISPDVNSGLLLEAFISPFELAHHGRYRLLVEEASDGDGYMAELLITGSGGAYSGKLIHYDGGVGTEYAFSSGNTGHADAGWFRMEITGTHPNYTITVKWAGVTLLTQAVTDLDDGATRRLGFGMLATIEGGRCLVGTFRAQYYVTTTGVAQLLRSKVVASAGGELWRETWQGILGKLTTNLTLAADHPVEAVERGQRVYIADWSDPAAEATDGTVAGAANDELDSPTYTDWTALGLNDNDFVAVLSAGNPSSLNGTYQITVQAAHLHLSPAPGAGVCSFRIERGPKVYDPSADTLSIWTATSGKGAVPSGCRSIARYRDRLVLAGAADAPHNWYAARLGDPLDFDYSQTDRGAAIAGDSAESGMLGEPATALAPAGDDALVYGCTSSLYVMRGDATYGGMIDDLDPAIGIVDAAAWCRVRKGPLVFMSADGLYMLPAAAGGTPEPLSRERLPRELLRIDRDAYDVSLAYDLADRGIHIFVTGRDAKGTTHWWFDWERGAFWPVTVPDNYEATCLLEYEGQGGTGGAVLMGGRDGYVRRFERDALDDDGTAIASHVVYGPVRLGGTGAAADLYEGMVMQLVGAPGELANDIDWSLFTGATAEAAVRALTGTADATGTWTGGLNTRASPRRRGHSALVKLANGANAPWDIERVTMLVKRVGPQRL